MRPAEPERFAERLAEAGVRIAVRNGLARFAPSYYNTEAEVRAAVAALGVLPVLGRG